MLMVSKGGKNKNSWLFSETLTGLAGHRDDGDSSFNYHQNSKKFFINISLMFKLIVKCPFKKWGLAPWSQYIAQKYFLTNLC